jgi:hypothetical protein
MFGKCQRHIETDAPLRRVPLSRRRKTRMTRKLRNAILAGALAALPVVSLAATTAAVDAGSRTTAALAEKVRKELVTLPYYGVFDNFAFTVEDGTVTLMGHVSRPTLKSGA